MMQDRKLLLALVLAAGALAQDTQQESVFSMDVSRVVLYASVREGKSKFVGDLQKQNFTVLEDGVAQKLLSFSRDDVPVAVGLLVDNSGSMLNKRAQVVAAASAFVHASNPEDEMFVIHFNEKLSYALPPETPFSGDAKVLDAALGLMTQDGRTALYDAIYEGLQHLATSKLTKKALIVISDGGDNMSQHKDSQVIREADLSGSLFYAIGIYDEMDGDANPGVLRKLAQSTGGEVYFPKDVNEVKVLCETIARDLRSQYMLSYAPAQTAAKEYRRLQVKVKDPRGRKLIVRTRTGYYTSQR